jgi:hypothetical protein
MRKKFTMRISLMTRMSILKVAAVVASETAEKIGYF